MTVARDAGGPVRLTRPRRDGPYGDTQVAVSHLDAYRRGPTGVHRGDEPARREHRDGGRVSPARRPDLRPVRVPVGQGRAADTRPVRVTGPVRGVPVDVLGTVCTTVRDRAPGPLARFRHPQAPSGTTAR